MLACLFVFSAYFANEKLNAIYFFCSDLKSGTLFHEGHVLRRASPRLPRGWTLLLSLSSGVVRLRPGRPGPRLHLHHLHAGILCLLLQNLDRGVRLLRQGREFLPLYRRRCWKLIHKRTFQTAVAPLPQVAKQLKEQQMVMRGHRETSMVHELNRYIHALFVLFLMSQSRRAELCLLWCCEFSMKLYSTPPVLVGTSPPPLPLAACASVVCQSWRISSAPSALGPESCWPSPSSTSILKSL